MVELVGAKTDLRRVGSRWTGPVPVPRRAHAVVLGQRRAEALPLLRLRGQGRRDRVRAGDRGARLPRGGRAARRALRRGARARARGPARRGAPRAGGSGCTALLDRATRFYATYLWESAEAAQAREYLAGPRPGRGGAARVPRRLLAERVGPGARGAPARRVHPGGAGGAGLGQRGRQGGLYDRFRGADHVPARRRARPGARLRGARPARGPAAEVPQHLGERALPQGPPAVRHRPRARGRAQARRVVVVEGYTDVLALHQAGRAEAVAIMGTALTQEQLAELAQAVGQSGTIFLALDADRSGQEAMLRAARGGAGPRTSSCGWSRCPRARPRRPRARRRARGVRRRCLDVRAFRARVSGAPGSCRCRP